MTSFLTGSVKPFFTEVEYCSKLEDTSTWTGMAEVAAAKLRMPGRWVASELWKGGKKCVIIEVNETNYRCYSIPPKRATGMKKAARIVLGILLGVPGHILAVPFMGFAYTNSEIRLKHQFSIRSLKDEERATLSKMIEERKKLAGERKGCEPISCMLLSIVCLLCCIVCVIESILPPESLADAVIRPASGSSKKK